MATTKRQTADLHARLTADIKQYLENMVKAAKYTTDTEGKITKAMKRAGTSTNALSAAQKTGGFASKQFGMMMQQSGYQVQDFAVQVAGGTSAMRALGMQAPQLLGIFGPAGAIAGAAVAVGALAAQMLMFGKNTEEATKKLGTFEEEVTKLRKQQAEMLFKGLSAPDKVVDIDKKIATLISEREKLATIPSEIALRRERQSLVRERSELRGNEPRWFEVNARIREIDTTDVDKAQARIAQITAEINTLREQQKEFSGEAGDLGKKMHEAAMQRIADADAAIVEQFGKELELAQQKTQLEEQVAETKRRIQKIVDDDLRRQQEQLVKDSERIMTQANRITLAAMLPSDRERAEAEAFFAEINRLSQLGALSQEQLAVATEAYRLKLKEVGELKAFEDLTPEMKRFTENIARLGQTIDQDLTDAIVNFVRTGKLSLASLADMVINEVLASFIQLAIVGPLLRGIFGGFGGFLGLPAANGGFRDGSAPFLVGERGPELFYPGTPGTVLSADKTASMIGHGSGDVIVNQTFNLGGGVSRSELATMLPRVAQAAKEGAVAAVYDNARRRRSG